MNSRISARGAVSKPTTKRAKSSRALATTNQATVAQQEKLLQEAKAKSTAGRGSSHNTTHQSTSKTATPVAQKRSKQSTTPKTSPKKDGADDGPTEKRLRRFRSKPPASFDVKLHRARTQRMIVLDRRRSTTQSGAPAEDIDIVGSTGNIYTVHIGHETSCTCPDSVKGNECKHKVYALNTVLKAPEVLVYQLAFLSPELKQIFAKAPPIPTDGADGGEDNDTESGNRKPTDGECPICYMDLNPNRNKLVWCKSQCGHNLHKSCFDQWAASQRGQEVRCVYCRSPWQAESGDLEAAKKAGKVGDDGYVNVADQFGMSRARDYSGYHQPWVRRRFGVGW